MDSYRAHVLVCGGAGCVSSGCKAVEQAFLDEIAKHGLASEVRVVSTGCMGPCELGPVAVVYPEGVLYRKLKAEDARTVVAEHLLKGRIVESLLYEAPDTQQRVPTCGDITFFNRQVRIALRNTGKIDPLNIEEYIAEDGYAALAKVLTEMSPEQVVDVVKRSGLRGRGGAGFPTGLKWDFTRRAKADQKYVVCNADEGDPGAFMDRSVLEGDPHSVIEAMAIAGYAIGASQGYVYVRAEYPLAVKHLGHAIMQAREYGVLGKDIFGKGFDFDVDIRVGAGAFVCGEETALLASVEGRRGEPRPRPPFPANEGLWGKPTLINNVETYANIPPIILRGPEWFASIGTEKSKGTKVFALAGKINNTGLVEVPMGIPLGEIIFDIGGGIPGGKKFKAAQTGGPSGGCVPAEFLNTSVDYESLKELGTIMGSGGLIVMDEDTCMVDLARFFLEFTQDESCGKCAPCRIGTKRMLEILTRITRGQGREGDIERLIKLGTWIKETALCGLGQTAPNPVLTTIRYFRNEYEAHIRDKRCPASVCAALFEAPCQNACPAGVDVPRYISLIRQKRYQDAVKLIKEKNPFPAVCGRVCTHPCEGKCRRSQLDEAVAICELKRFAADWELMNPLPPEVPAVRKDAKVAIVGSGPAGLTAAYYLAGFGYQVTVFESLPEAGGMLRAGIPEYRLPKDVLDAEILDICRRGVEIRTGVAVGKDITLEELKQQGYKAIFIAIGANVSQKLGVPGEDLGGVVGAVEFLRDVNIGGHREVGKKVAVIGGGNAAIDAARTALRLGAKEVHIIYRRQREDMPADKNEVAEAEREGVKIHFLTAPSKMIGSNGRVVNMECVRMSLGEFDRTGRRRPVPIEGSNFVIDVDMVISAISQRPDSSVVCAGSRIEVTKWSTVVADPRTHATGEPGVFAGGDCVNGPDTVIQAIADGRRAAEEIDMFLGGTGKIPVSTDLGRELAGELHEERMMRQHPEHLTVSERKGNFDEVVSRLSEAAALYEASRCLRCDVKD
ncbi:MAG: NADH-quinone oxidoreductase subunit NuoF [Clostridia bacterium]